MKSTENDPYPIYYYRGNVTNNHLIFGGFCWRIVRTTETGGTKLIYNGTPNEGKCTATGTDTQITTSKFNNNNNSPAYVGYKYGSTHPSYLYTTSSTISNIGTIVYGKNIAYQNGKYTLTDTITNSNYTNGYNDTSQSGLRYHHYTCFTNSSTCSTVYYIYYLESNRVFHFSLTGGKNITQTLNEMLSDNDGTDASNAYTELNTWYRNNLLSSASKLEDTVFCNDRSISNYGGLDINNANTTYLYFGVKGRLVDNKSPSLVCQNPGDRYTVSKSKGNGQLEYPIGLLTADEYALAGAISGSINNSFYLYNGQNQWSMSPSYLSLLAAFELGLNSSGKLNTISVAGSARGLRPVVSLLSSATITGGNGTSTNPYIVGN